MYGVLAIQYSVIADKQLPNQFILSNYDQLEYDTCRCVYKPNAI